MLPTWNKKDIAFNLTDGNAYICSSSLTVMGLGMWTPPFIKVEWHLLDTTERYNLLMQVFEGSKKNVPMPENPKEYSEYIIKELGQSSWKKFYENGAHCSISFDLDKKEYEFIPLIYEKESKSLSGVKHGIEILSSDANPEEVIATLERVLDKIPRLADESAESE